MDSQFYRSRARSFRWVCWVVLAACFSPSQEEKQLLEFDGGTASRTTTMEAGVSAGPTPVASEPGLDASPAPSAGPGAADAMLDAFLVAPVANHDANVDAAPIKLLFPSNCKAPWEETTKYHAAGYNAAKVHGPESNLNKDDCKSCHGDKLEGCANSPSCDNCHDGGHPKDWRKKCTYCHGGADNMLGAPPRDIDGQSAKETLSFMAHSIHVKKERHKAYDCDSCHKKHEDALDPGHMYDDTPGKAEVTFDAGLSKDGMYMGDGKCANLYCHGDARNKKGAIAHSDPKLTCKGCHADVPTTGHHPSHTGFGFWCSECHGQTVDDTGMAISGPDNHVNGKVDLAMPDNNMMWTNGTCTGVCHVIVFHTGDKW